MIMMEESVDSLDELEGRIRRAVQVIKELRIENDGLQTRLQKLQAELSVAQTERDEANQLSEEFQKETAQLEGRVRTVNAELETMRDGRRQGKVRIEKLMSQLDLLSAS